MRIYHPIAYCWRDFVVSRRAVCELKRKMRGELKQITFNLR